MNIAEYFRQQAAASGDGPALIDVHRGRERVLSFRQAEATSGKWAAELARAGMKAGDAALILHPMSAELYVFLIALFRIGGVGMFLDPAGGLEQIERCLALRSPKALFAGRNVQCLRLGSRPLRRIPLAFCTSRFPGTRLLRLAGREAAAAPLPAPAPAPASAPVSADTPALITFTSGSTGAPKAALRSHGFLLAQYHALKQRLGLRAGATDLASLPIFVLANLAVGVASILPDADMRTPGQIVPGPVLRQMRKYGATTLAASPAFVGRRAMGCAGWGGRLQGLERVFIGGAPVFPDDMRLARQLFPGAEVTAVYGSTEAEPMADINLAAISPEDFRAMEAGWGLLAGRPVPSLSLKIMPASWGKPLGPFSAGEFLSRCLPAGEVGEIVVSGDHVLSGYLNGEGEAEIKFKAGDANWHRTGDLGWLDPSGRLWLMGRAAAAMQDPQGVLYPFSVECAARSLPGVRRAAALAMGGRRVLAVETDQDGIADLIGERMAWAHLDEIRVLPRIPMDKRHNAKVDYAALAGELGLNGSE